MDWIVYAIWFGCGYMCREIILRNEIARTNKEIREVQRKLKPETDAFLQEMKDFSKYRNSKEFKQYREKLNGNNKHSK